ncbi:MAG TPA: AraC family transcriptional regulator [Balneolales bacterium]|nr:AraC family transcriptional regulator [Balneolales bacterium]
MSERIPISKVVEHLFANIDKIKTVNEWSQVSGYSKTYFLHKTQIYYGATPENLLRSIRLMKILEELHENPQKISYAIARDVGLNDDNSLCYFVKRYFGITPLKLKKKVRDYSNYVKIINKVCDDYGVAFNRYALDYVTVHDKRLVA